ncbi:13087_t:CDS:1, partial [Gigaspora margarita]
MMNPRTRVNIIDVDAENLLQFKLTNNEDASTRLLEPNVITSDHVIGVSNDQLWIQNIEFKVNSLVDTFFCRKQINQIIKDAGKSTFPVKQEHHGDVYSWIVEFTNNMEVLLIAQKYDHEIRIWNK